MAFEFLERASEKSYDKFNEMAQHLIGIVNYFKQMRDDAIMIFTFHSENVGDILTPKIEIKTLGKLVKDKMSFDGLFTCLFFTKVIFNENTQEVQYKFITNTDGVCCAKTPMGMFSEHLIDNDLSQIIPIMNTYDNAE